MAGYKSGVKMRYLKGDMKWLWENIESRGQHPDGVSPPAAIATFARDFIRRQSYDYMDRHDLGPAIAALAGNVNLTRLQTHKKAYTVRPVRRRPNSIPKEQYGVQH